MVTTLSPQQIQELQQLTRAQKFEAMQILLSTLAAEDNLMLTHGTEYEVWSPYDSGEAAVALIKLLQGDQDA